MVTNGLTVRNGQQKHSGDGFTFFVNPPAIDNWQVLLPTMRIYKMGITFVPTKAKKNGHTLAKAPTISLDQPGRLRVAHLMSLLGVGHSTLYAGLRRKRYPQPDGYDGKIPFWRTETIKQFLQR